MGDIFINTDKMIFTYRVGAVIIHNGSVLMVKNERYPYYYPVGGAVKYGETSESAVLREVYEETGICLEVDRLAYIHENFFTADFMGPPTPAQELRLYYLMKTTDDINNIKCDSEGMGGGKEFLHWMPIDKLTEHQIFPDFYKTELKNLSTVIRRFMTREGVTVRT